MKRLLVILCTVSLLLLPTAASADITQSVDEPYYTIYQQDGSLLTYIGGRVYVEDEYIGGDNKLYRVYAVDETACHAWAEYIGEEVMMITDSQAIVAYSDLSRTMSAAAGSTGSENKKIAIYCTHSDESYVPSDGTSSIDGYGGIYDVADSFAQELKNIGIEVVQDYTSHLPHDAGAYRRSRPTAVELLKSMPDALVDIHRDGIPDPTEYENNLHGEDITMVRLLVGRSNPNAQSNRDFAKSLKSVADEMYPGLIKDIFIGKGNYNQELSPRSILLEFGTHENEKELAQNSTKYMAQVLSQTLYGSVNDQSGGAAQNNTQGTTPNTPDNTPLTQSNTGAWSGIWWILGIAVGGGLLFLLYSRGGKHFGRNVGRSMSELTGGLVGKKPDDEDKDRLDDQ